MSGYPLLHEMKLGSGAADVKHIRRVCERLKYLQAIELPDNLFEGIPMKCLRQYQRQVSVESPSHLLRREENQSEQMYTLLATFCRVRQREVTDDLVDLFIRVLKDVKVRAEHKEEKRVLSGFIRVDGKQQLLFNTHGQSEVGFAFCRLLGFQLMPRLKNIYEQKLHVPHLEDFDKYPSLAPILKSVIDWELIRQQYDEMVKYATALRLGTAQTEAILKCFTRHNIHHPTYEAFSELGRAIKTIFLCRYLHAVDVRQEIFDGLQVIENWNSANGFIFYGNQGDIASNDVDAQEITILAMHLLQTSMTYINTLIVQQVLAEPSWYNRFTDADWRGLTPLFYKHINPYGSFNLDMASRIPLAS